MSKKTEEFIKNHKERLIKLDFLFRVYDPPLSWNHTQRTHCPACKSPGIYKISKKGQSGGLWEYPCGASWTDYGHWPQNIGADVADAEGEVATPEQLGRNPQCTYIRELIRQLTTLA